MKMKAYKCISKGHKHPTFIVDAGGQFHTTYEEFRKAYGFNRLDTRNQIDYMRGLTNSRMSLFKDKTRLNLMCNPMTDDLAVVFSEWIAKRPGFIAVSEDELNSSILIEEFEFPY
jgi:hypothetical protein